MASMAGGDGDLAENRQAVEDPGAGDAEGPDGRAAGLAEEALGEELRIPPPLTRSLNGDRSANAGQHASLPTSVISLTLLDGATLGSSGAVTADTRVLVGVRRSETNLTHPAVVSTPTQRVPCSVFGELLANCPLRELSHEIDLWFPERLLRVAAIEATSNDSLHCKSHNAAVYVVESLLARKLGLAEALECGEVDFTATPVAVVYGSVLYDDLADARADASDDLLQLNHHTVPVKIKGRRYLREYHAMCSVRVVMNDASLVPNSTSSYSALRWLSVNQFLEMARQRDVGLAFGAERGIEYCVHGLCITSSYVYLNALGLLTPTA